MSQTYWQGAAADEAMQDEHGSSGRRSLRRSMSTSPATSPRRGLQPGRVPGCR